MQTLPLGTYTHYKGKRYEVVGTATRESDLEPVIIYKTLYDASDFPLGSIFTRPLKEFTELVDCEGKKIPRFSPYKKTELPISLWDIFQLCWFPYTVLMINVIIMSFSANRDYLYNADWYLHFFGGVSIAYSARYAIKLLEKNNIVKINNRFLQIFQIVAIVALAAVLWEMFEWYVDITSGTHFQVSLWDTMKDLTLGTLGGLIFALLAQLKKPTT